MYFFFKLIFVCLINYNNIRYLLILHFLNTIIYIPWINKIVIILIYNYLYVLLNKKEALSNLLLYFCSVHHNIDQIYNVYLINDYKIHVFIMYIINLKMRVSGCRYYSITNGQWVSTIDLLTVADPGLHLEGKSTKIGNKIS